MQNFYESLKYRLYVSILKITKIWNFCVFYQIRVKFRLRANIRLKTTQNEFEMGTAVL